MNKTGFKIGITATLILAWIVLVYVNRTASWIERNQEIINILTGSMGVFLVICYIWGWEMRFGAAKIPSLKEDSSQYNRIGRVLGVLIAICFFGLSVRNSFPPQ